MYNIKVISIESKKDEITVNLGTLLQLLFITVQVSTRALKMRAKISSLKTD